MSLTAFALLLTLSATPAPSCVQKIRTGVIDEKLCARKVDATELAKQIQAAVALPKEKGAGRFIRRQGQRLHDGMFRMLADAAPRLRAAFGMPKTQDHDVLTPLSRGASPMHAEHAVTLRTLRAAERCMLDAALKYGEITELADWAFAFSLARKGLALRTAVRRVAAINNQPKVFRRLRRARAKATATLFAGLAEYEQHHRRYIAVPPGFMYPDTSGFLTLKRLIEESNARQRASPLKDVRFKKVNWSLIEKFARQRNALKRAYDEVDAIEAQIDAAVAQGAWSALIEAPSTTRVLASLQADVGTDDFGFISFVRREGPRGTGNENAKYAAYYLNPTLGFPVFWDVGDATVVDQKIRDFLVLLLDEKSTSAAVQAAGKKLFTDLFSVAATFGLPRQLIISPDGQLHRLPFVALTDPEGRWLADQHEISLYGVPAMTKPRPPAPRTKLSAIAFIDPALPPPTQSGPLRQAFDRLPDAKNDVLALRKSLASFQEMTDSRADEGYLDRHRAPDILHFGTHGIFLGAVSRAAGLATAAEARYDNIKPKRGVRRQHTRAWYHQRLVGMQLDRIVPEDDELGWADAALVLAPPKTAPGSGYEGYLTAYEIGALNLSPTQLVVLAACESGVGGVSAWHGTFSLESAFLAAGAQSVVASRWPVASAATATLMNHFYEQLMAGKTRAAALQAAMQAVRRSKDTAHPYFWASFALTGARGRVVQR